MSPLLLKTFRSVLVHGFVGSKRTTTMPAVIIAENSHLLKTAPCCKQPLAKSSHLLHTAALRAY